MSSNFKKSMTVTDGAPPSGPYPPWDVRSRLALEPEEPSQPPQEDAPAGASPDPPGAEESPAAQPPEIPPILEAHPPVMEKSASTEMPPLVALPAPLEAPASRPRPPRSLVPRKSSHTRESGSESDLEPEPFPGSPHAFALHARRCSICAHPQREEIEHDFLRWTGFHEISKRYGLDDPLLPTGRGRQSLLRHGRAAGLYTRRARNIRGALERIIESVDDIPFTGANILQAIQMFTQLDEEGRPTDSHRGNTQITYRIEHATLPPGSPEPPPLLKP